MTVNVTTGPGVTAYESTRYTASVNGSASVVYGQTHAMTHASEAWDYNESVEVSWTKFNTDETTTVSIAKTSGSVTSAVVYPKNVVAQNIVGGVLILTGVPSNTRLHIEINGDRANAMLVFSQPLARAIPAGAVYWDDVGVKPVSISGSTFTSASHGLANGTRVGFRSEGTYPTSGTGDLAPHTHYYIVNQTSNTFQLARTSGGTAIALTGTGSGTRTVYITSWTNTTNALVFPFGEWHCGRLFELADDVTIVVDVEAILIGGFDLRARNRVSIFGEGLMLGTYATHAEVFAGSPTFVDQLPYCMFLGYDAGTSVRWNNEVQGITIASLPFFTNFEGVCEWTNVQAINPWFYGTLTPQVSSQSDILPAGQMTYCYCYSGDDVMTLGEQTAGFYAVIQGCFFVTSNNSCLHFGYWSGPDAGTFCFVRECELMHLGVADNGPGSTVFPTYGGNSIMKCWTDGYKGKEQYGRYDVFVQDCRVWGPHAARLLHMGNFAYPFTYYGDESRAQKGQAARFTFARIAVEKKPGQLGIIKGLDWLNTPHDLAFLRWTVAGELVTTTNYTDYLTIGNAYPYNITIGGKPVVTSVDICNRALDLIGHQKRITALGPSDGSAEALTCNDHYTSAVNELLELREWSFATVKRKLEALDKSDDPAYDYAYKVPEGMLKAIALLEDGASDNYLRNGFEVAPQNYELHADLNGVVRIYSDTAGAWLRFTKYVTNPNYFTPQFLNALYWLLASKIAGAIIKGAEGGRERDRCLQMFAMALGEAAKVDAVQQKRPVETPIARWQRRGPIQ